MFDILKDDAVRLMLNLIKQADNYDIYKNDLLAIDLHAFFDLCVEHETDGIIASVINKYNLCELPDYWIEKYSQEVQRLSFLKNKANDICKIMSQNGIKMVILKNGGIMADIVDDPAACPMEDIDSLVKKNDFKKAHEILIRNGFVFKFRSEFEFEELERAFRDGSTEYYILMPNGEKMWFELSWRAVAGRWIRLDKEPDTDKLISNSHFAEGSKVGILSPEDNLLQVCIHTAKHSYVRAPGLRLHTDVDRIVSNTNIDWELFLEKVSNAHVKTAVYFSLLIPSRLFGTNIPIKVFEELKPSKAKEKRILKLLGKAGLLYPHRTKFSRIGFLQFQLSLYDSLVDMLRVLYPKNNYLHELYDYKSPLFTPYYIVIRGLDLIGIRKKKKD